MSVNGVRGEERWKACKPWSEERWRTYKSQSEERWKKCGSDVRGSIEVEDVLGYDWEKRSNRRWGGDSKRVEGREERSMRGKL